MDKNKFLEGLVERWRLKQALRQAGLNHSFFTCKRTKARRKNYRYALHRLPNDEIRQQCLRIWPA